MSATLPLIEVQIASIKDAAEGIKLFELHPLSGMLPAATPGSHIDLHLRHDLIRPYSLISTGDSLQSYVVGVKREPDGRGGSRLLHDEFQTGDILKISAPRNNFLLNPNAKHAILVAGGIGITPIYSMVKHLAAQGASWELHYSCRSVAFCAFREALEQFGPRAKLYFDDVMGPGAIDFVALARHADADLYCCGPGGMLTAFEKACANLPASRVHIERFNADVDATSGEGFMLELARSGKVIFVPDGKSILDCLNESGYNVPYSCEQGVCGTCETRVLEGIPDHRDLILTKEERESGKTIMVCCSRSLSPKLKLDI